MNWRLLLALVAAAYGVVRLVLDPSWVGELADEVWWLALTIILSEILLTVGILGAVWQAGTKSWRARREWRSFDWRALGDDLRDNQKFWAFFWLTVIGGLGDGIALSTAILHSIPPEAWTLLALPALDIWGTLVVRRTIYVAITAPVESG